MSGRRGPLAGRLKRAAGWPARRLLDPRVDWAVNQIDDRLGSQRDTRPTVHERLDGLEGRLDALEQLERSVLHAVGHAVGPENELEVGLERLGPAAAALLNWANGPHGFAAQAGLWFNPPAPVEHREGAVDLLHVNERIVEQPWVFGAVAAATGGRPARLLDLGGGESTVGVSLASLGHRVTLVDPRGLRLAHPNLTVRGERLEQTPDDAGPFDAAVVLSAVEHFGLEHYGTPRGVERADLEALARVRELVRPGGALILTVPIGAPSVDGFQRVYDRAGVAELTAGWTVDERTIVRQQDRLTWVREPDDAGDDQRRGVALVRAHRD
ncbi:class I SAM-dependent methyltransferase [Patulibacter defluvii]|uniref:class I SAM-dependent methyltransferase n=1 Tax=Patulibacter defluvii TaxID=3095358 RepID=UPI002A75E5FD|nr:class I SAM-dependent methyltransferase [Patulibacter sp. DM4]